MARYFDVHPDNPQPRSVSQVVANRAIRHKMLQGNEPASTVMIAETVDGKWLLEIEAIAAE